MSFSLLSYSCRVREISLVRKLLLRGSPLLVSGPIPASLPALFTRLNFSCVLADSIGLLHGALSPLRFRVHPTYSLLAFAPLALTACVRDSMSRSTLPIAQVLHCLRLGERLMLPSAGTSRSLESQGALLMMNDKLAHDNHSLCIRIHY